MKVSDILNIKSIEVDVQIASKDDLLDRLIDLAIHSGQISDKEEAKKEVYKREKIMSTGVGKGIALPHAKTDAVKDTVGALVVLKEHVDFESLDDQPINIAFLLLGKEHNVGKHLKLLSKISRLMNNDSFRERLTQAKAPQSVLDLFNEVED